MVIVGGGDERGHLSGSLVLLCLSGRAATNGQDLTLGIFRSDYMLHEANEGGELTIQQVEFNTISSSFAALSQKTGNLHRCAALPKLVIHFVIAGHRYLSRTGAYPSEASLTEEALPANAALEGLVDGLAAAHEAYGQPRCAQAFLVTVEPGC